jgi:hypothetical protein
MSYYVGHITRPAHLPAQETLDGRVEALGYDRRSGYVARYEKAS